MKSTRLGANVKDLQNAENRPSELRKRDFRAGAPTARFSSWPRKRPFFARVHMKSSHFSSTQRIGATRSSESETFVSGRSLLELSMKSIHFGSNVENRPFGAPKLALAQTHNMKSTPFRRNAQNRPLGAPKARFFRAGLGNCRLLLKFILKSTHFSSSAENRKANFSSWPRKRPFFTRVLRHVLAQTQRIGQSELQKRDFTNLQATL